MMDKCIADHNSANAHIKHACHITVTVHGNKERSTCVCVQIVLMYVVNIIYIQTWHIINETYIPCIIIGGKSYMYG